MPSISQSQQSLMAIAEHAPNKVFKRNRGVLKMSMKSLSEFARTPRTGLPKKVKKQSGGY